jgi:hypothetical protein
MIFPEDLMLQQVSTEKKAPGILFAQDVFDIMLTADWYLCICIEEPMIIALYGFCNRR